MPVYEYTARNMKGDLVRDKIDLATRDDVIAHLRKNRMIVVQVREAKGKGGGLADFFKAGVKTRDVVIFTRQFATMINSGLPLVQALDILSQQTENKVLADVTRQVVYDVESGTRSPTRCASTPRRSPICTSTWWPRVRRAVFSTRFCSASRNSSKRTTRSSAK